MNHACNQTTTRPSFPVRAICNAVILSLLYTPMLGQLTNTVALAQSVAQGSTSYEYDALGNLTKVTDPLNRKTDFGYDPLNRMTQQVQPVPTAGRTRPTSTFTYDALDQLTTVVDPRALTTSYTTTGLGDQTKLASPDTGVSGNTFDEAGNLKTSTDARDKTTSYSYDALNRVTSVSYQSGVASSFEYDGGTNGTPSDIGHLTRMADESGQTSYSYDALGRLLSKAQSTHTVAAPLMPLHSVTYSYGSEGSALGKLASISYPSGARVNYSYDTAGRVNGVTLNPSTLAGSTDSATTLVLLSEIGYAPFGAVQSWNWGNHSADHPNSVARTFDQNGRLTSYPLGNPAAGGLLRSVSYDAASRISAIAHTGGGTGALAPANFNQSYGYDDLDRLTSFIAGNTTQAFNYDASGNRTLASFGGASYANTVSATSNRLSGTAGPAPAKSNSYDGAGNLNGDGSITYSYSDRGRLQRVTNAGVRTDYLYNGLGQRVAKSGAAIASGVNVYVYDEQGHLLGEYDAVGEALQETVYLGDLPVAVLRTHHLQTPSDPTPTPTPPADTSMMMASASAKPATPKTSAPRTTAAMTSSAMGSAPATTVYYVYADHINTARVIASASDGGIVWRWDSADPFGLQQPNEHPGTAAAFTYNPRFPGQLYDKESNNHYNYFRDYDPQTGRYIESDPVGLKGGVNTYAYVAANPLRAFDPFGLCQCKGKARVFQGNSALIGRGGGFNTNPPNLSQYAVTSDSTAVIPSQFGLTKAAMRPIVNQINGSLADGTAIGRVRDVMDDAPTRRSLNMTTLQFQQHLIDRESTANGGVRLLMLELPGASRDLGVQDVTINMPDGYPCPEGTE